MKEEELMEFTIQVRELGLKLVDFAYANQYADMGDMGEVEEWKDTIREQFKELFGEVEK